MNRKEFQHIVRSYYAKNKRTLLWREKIDPYWVVISEIMLQQTQVPRVMIKFPEFISVFPTFQDLADAPLDRVLRAWQGLGYNRRGKYLHQIAHKIMTSGGRVSRDPMILETYPGIGPATARSIVTFAYNSPDVFIETNIRRVMIHHFFEDAESIHDREILPLVSETLDVKNPREWYYALMDYGSHLGKTIKNPNLRSKHYAKQSAFEGSSRQVRSACLKQILADDTLTIVMLCERTGYDLERVQKAIDELLKEQMIQEKEGIFSIQNEK